MCTIEHACMTGEQWRYRIIHVVLCFCSSENDEGECLEQLQLVLLDFGLAEELPPVVRYHFLSFIMNIGAADGECAVCSICTQCCLISPSFLYVYLLLRLVYSRRL